MALYTVPSCAPLDYHVPSPFPVVPRSFPRPSRFQFTAVETVPLNPDQPDPPLAPVPAARRPVRPPTRLERLEAWLSRLSIKNNFFHKLFSLVWLPYAAR